MRNIDLDGQLNALQDAAKQQTSDYESSREKLYQNIVDTYLWWRDADQIKNYLKDKYDVTGIRTRRKKANKPNFYPVVRLVWNIDISKKASTVSEWAQSLLALHEFYTEDPKRFASNARADLINYIHDMGGLSELRGVRSMTEQELYDEEDADLVEIKEPEKKPIDSFSTLAQSKAQLVSTLKPKASLPAFPSAVTNADELVVMLARRNPNTNQLDIVGTSQNEDLMQTAIVRCVEGDRSKISDSLRLIAEALTPHAVPFKFEKYRKNFFDKSRTVKRVQADGKTEKLPESTTLLIEPSNNEIIVTKSPKRMTCVTHVTPKTVKLHDGDTLVMRGADRSWFEKVLIGEDQLSLYSAEPAETLKETHTKEKHRFGLTLTNNSTKLSRTAYFYPLSEVPNDTNDGMRIENNFAFDTEWEIHATAQWLSEFDAKCVTQWINAMRGFFNKPQNKKVGLRVDEDTLYLHYWWEKDKATYEKKFSMPFNNGSSITITKKTGLLELFPKDAMLLFAGIPSLPLSQVVTSIKASSKGMLVDYETDIANYRSFLPSYDAYEKDEAQKALKTKKPPKQKKKDSEQ